MSRRLGKLRQWAGEIVSSREKTEYTDEFRELEKDIELRKCGAEKIVHATEGYHRALSKKKANPGLDDKEKLLPIDALGMVMVLHGEEFAEDSELGQSMVRLGRAHIKVATLQEAYALTLKDTFLVSLKIFADEMKEYDALRRKLDSRRLAYDACRGKAEKLKGSKKEKERLEAEEEEERAKFRYEETTEDIRAHMQAIQEREDSQLRELTNLLDLEMNFVEQYLDVLREAKAEWTDYSPNPPKVSHRGSTRSRPNSVRSKPSRPPSPPTSALSSDEDDDGARTSRNRQPRKRQDSSGAKSRSRPTSVSSRKRSDSTGTTTKESSVKEREKTSRTISVSGVAGWASNTVGSFTGRSSSKKDREQFANLGEGEGAASPVLKTKPESSPVESNGSSSMKDSLRSGISRRLSGKNKTKDRDRDRDTSAVVPPWITMPQQKKRVVKALYDFEGSVDELAFRAGDEIVVVSEVLDGWWMGEVKGTGAGGKQGLFPSAYTDMEGGKGRVNGKEMGKDSETDSQLSRDDADEDVFSRQPLSAASMGPFFGGASDVMSITSAEETRGLINTDSGTATKMHARTDSQTRKILNALDPSQMHGMPMLRRKTNSDASSSNNSNGSGSGNSNSASTPVKKTPPPPPPRRLTSSNLVPPPAVPPRRPTVPRSNSGSVASFATATSASGSLSVSNGSSSHGTVDYDTSPFESDADLRVGGEGKRCAEFKQNPFKPKGLCSSCLQYHL